MDDVVSRLLSYDTIIIMVCAVVFTFFIRRIVELRFPKLKKQVHENAPGLTYLTPMAEWWNTVILYAIPVILGGALSMALKEIESDVAVHWRMYLGSALHGVVVGWASGFGYKVLAKTAKAKTGVELPGVSVYPASDDEPVTVVQTKTKTETVETQVTGASNVVVDGAVEAKDPQ